MRYTSTAGIFGFGLIGIVAAYGCSDDGSEANAVAGGMLASAGASGGTGVGAAGNNGTAGAAADVGGSSGNTAVALGDGAAGVMAGVPVAGASSAGSAGAAAVQGSVAGAASVATGGAAGSGAAADVSSVSDTENSGGVGGDQGVAGANSAGSPAAAAGTAAGGTSSDSGDEPAAGGESAGGDEGGAGGADDAGGASNNNEQGGAGGEASENEQGSAGAGVADDLAVDASDGCGDASPSLGSSGSPLTVSGHQYYVKLPGDYDGSTPYPVLFMFNPTNNPINWAEQNAGFERNAAKDEAIRVYPHPSNSSSGWGSGDVSFFVPLYEEITGSFCADKARMFAAGESSGGDFSSILGCEHADLLRAIGPGATKNVGSYPLDAGRRECTGQVTSVVIHGLNDNVVGPENGPKTRDFYLELNHCTDENVPVDGYTDSQSNCVEYQGCDAGYPVFWCGHTDPNYSGTNHGWPGFAADMLWELFSSY